MRLGTGVRFARGQIGDAAVSFRFFSSRPPEGHQITQSTFSPLPFFSPFESVRRPLEDTRRHGADHFTLITGYGDDPKNMLFHLKRPAGSAARDVKGRRRRKLETKQHLHNSSVTRGRRRSVFVLTLAPA